MSLHGSGTSEVSSVVSQTKGVSGGEGAGPLPLDKDQVLAATSQASLLLPPKMMSVSGSASQSSCQDEVEEAASSCNQFSIPIVGYEIMEERARFTVYKLRVENQLTGDCWFVYRRYTDFVRLLCKLKNDFPGVKLSLPKKRWFRDNFDSRFLEERIQGLQAFVNDILQSSHLSACLAVKDFFCLNEPPSYAESMEESRVVFEVLEETVFHLRCQVQERDLQIEQLKKQQESLFNFIRMSTKECSRCFKDVVSMEATVPAASSTPLKDIVEEAEDSVVPPPEHG
ncbi:sorting nexin-16 [Bacillus rossius redtenbacheri]|uniref:sorting nexin-16 n=1 Tax=Bacillus rossius redtenbacheri TaxID=93214 RepID=UPI002FDF04D1